jgi:hypothetical protein
MLIRGKCHCGNISFLLAWEPTPAEIQARACTCSFCTKHGGVWTSYPRGALEVTVRDPAIVSKYAHQGTRTSFRRFLRLSNNPYRSADVLHNARRFCGKPEDFRIISHVAEFTYWRAPS